MILNYLILRLPYAHETIGTNMLTQTRNTILLSVLLLNPQILHADIYQIFWPEENLADPENNPNDTSWQAVKITNISSNTVIDGSMSGVYEQDFSNLISAASSANNNGTYELERSLTATNDGPTVLDFSGNTIKFRAEQALAFNPQGHNGETYTYDVVYEVNPSTGEVISSTLVASSNAEATLADEAGFIVDTEISSLDRSGASGTFQSYATNLTNDGNDEVNIATKGGLVTEQLSNPDGSSLLRKEEDGTVHIGQNSIVLADELVSSSGNDEIYSSSDVLQLGDDENHTTVVVGNLEVGTPTADNHAVNKAYADTQDAATLQSAKTYANGVAAMAMAASQISMNVDPNAKLAFGIGLGNVGNQHAFSIGFAGADQANGIRYSFTGSYNEGTGQSGIGAGVSIILR